MVGNGIEILTNRSAKSKNEKIIRPMMDLFAGCGGLSLGFENAGFTPIFVNELNEHARETYLINRHHKLGDKKFADCPTLITGDIRELDENRLKQIEQDLRNIDPSIHFGAEGTVDVLAGGPPCQGYSGIGHRRSYSVDKRELPSNQLYQYMAKFIERVQPKIFLFENVRGILSAKWTSEGKKGEIWDDVYERFKVLGQEYGYVVRWDLVYARDYGVPQNRPRILLVGIRKDVVRLVGDLLKVNADEHSAVKCNFLPMHGKYRVPDIVDLLSDLEDPVINKALIDQNFPKVFETQSYPSQAKSWVQKLLRAANDELSSEVGLTEQQYSKHAARIVEKFSSMIKHNGEILDEYKTKKFAQKVLPKRWGNKGPTITATSLPDDYVHYSQPRSLTVREWARLQTFPDWYQFAGKRTTGGLRRAGNPREGLHDREVPKYTQIGNAVPVWLAEAVALHFSRILSKSEDSSDTI